MSFLFSDLVRQILKANHDIHRVSKRPRSYQTRINNENHFTHAVYDGIHFLHVNLCTSAEMRRLGIEYRQVMRIIKGRPWESAEAMLNHVFRRMQKQNPRKYRYYAQSFYDSEAIYADKDITE